MASLRLIRVPLFLSVLVALLALSPLSGLGAPADLAPVGPAAVTVEVLFAPASVPVGQPVTVRWRITGGTTVSQTRVEWGLEPGAYPRPEPSYSGAPGEYEDTFDAPLATRIYLSVLAVVDGGAYRSAEKVVDIGYTCSFDDNHDPARPATIALNQTYTGCLGDSCEAYYEVAVPACSALQVQVEWSMVTPGSRGGGSIEAYDASGALLATGYPECSIATGLCAPTIMNIALPQGGTIRLSVCQYSPIYTLRASASPLSPVSDEFQPCSGGLTAPCGSPWYWRLIDPLRDAGVDYTKEFGTWWMAVPGGAPHDLRETTNAPRYMQSVCGDFAVETAVTFSHTGSYQGAGLLVWLDAENFFRWEVNDAGALRAMRMRDGAWTDSGDLDRVSGSVRLHVQRVGSRLDAFAYVGGVWTYYGSWDLAAGAVDVGLTVVNTNAATSASAEFEYFRAVSPRAVSPTPTPSPGTPTPGTPTPGTPVAEFEWSAQGEDGQLTAPMAIHAGVAACGGKYVSSNANNQGAVTFSVTVPAAGNYYLWARARGNDWTSNSFWVSFDAAAPVHYEVPPVDGQWVFAWDLVHAEGQAEGPFYLEAGTHTLRVAGREPGAALDALMLVSSSSFTPTGCPAATPTPTATRTPTPSHTPTKTLTPTVTHTPTQTVQATITPTPSRTLSPTLTPTPSRTLSPTLTRTPTETAQPGDTPTHTPTPSRTPTPTGTSLAPRLWLPLMFKECAGA